MTPGDRRVNMFGSPSVSTKVTAARPSTILRRALSPGRPAAGATPGAAPDTSPEPPDQGRVDLLTLIRAVLVVGVSADVAHGLLTGRAPGLLAPAMAAAALLIAGVGRWLARRGRTASPSGSRFARELDAGLNLVLSVHVATLLGPAVLALGLLRYGFVAAGRLLPWLRAPLPGRRAAAPVAGLTAVVLVLAAADVLPGHIMITLIAVALGLLLWSFGRDVAGLWRRAHPGAAEPDGDGRGETAARSRGSVVVTALAGALVFVALVSPNEITGLTPGAFLRVPVEAVLGVAALLALPTRAGRVLATLLGALLGTMTVLTMLDIGFSAALSRTFDPMLDWGLYAAVIDLLAGSLTRPGAVAAVIGIGLVGIGLVGVVMVSVRRLARVTVRRRAGATRVVAVLGPICAVCLVVGAQVVPGVPVASVTASVLAVDRAGHVRDTLRDPEVFARESAVDAFRDTPPDELLTGLRGKDVMFAFVESYGRDAIDDPEFATQIDALLDDGTRRLGAAGYGARSGYLTSPVAGGNSWLAHATFLSGLWINNQQRHDALVAGHRLTLTSAFQRANWRTVGVMPGTTTDWPEGRFYGYEQVYDARNLGYQGPNLGWASIPDQYSLQTFQRSERAVPGHAPLMAEVVLVSSHAPWPLIPDVIDWNTVGDGAVFHTMTSGEPRDAVWAKGTEAVRTAYRRSIEYSLSSLISYVQTYGDDNLVLVVLGDHQAAPVITGATTGREVPITLVARDRAVLDRISGWGWDEGLRPGPQAPIWRMDAFRDRFLSAFGPQTGGEGTEAAPNRGRAEPLPR